MYVHSHKCHCMLYITEDGGRDASLPLRDCHLLCAKIHVFKLVDWEHTRKGLHKYIWFNCFKQGFFCVWDPVSGGVAEECWAAACQTDVKLLEKMQQHKAQAWVGCNSCQSRDIIWLARVMQCGQISNICVLGDASGRSKLEVHLCWMHSLITQNICCCFTSSGKVVNKKLIPQINCNSVKGALLKYWMANLMPKKPHNLFHAIFCSHSVNTAQY